MELARTKPRFRFRTRMARRRKLTTNPSSERLRNQSCRPKKYRPKIMTKPMATTLSWSSMMSTRSIPWVSSTSLGVEEKTETTEMSMRNRAIRKITLSPLKRSISWVR